MNHGLWRRGKTSFLRLCISWGSMKRGLSLFVPPTLNLPKPPCSQPAFAQARNAQLRHRQSALRRRLQRRQDLGACGLRRHPRQHGPVQTASPTKFSRNVLDWLGAYPKLIFGPFLIQLPLVVSGEQTTGPGINQNQLCPTCRSLARRETSPRT